MTAFNPGMLVAASKSTEFSKGTPAAPKVMPAAAIGRQVALFKSPKEEGKRWVRVGQKEAAIQLRYANKLLKLLGEEETIACPVDRVEAALGYLKEQALAGKYDDQLSGLQQGREARVEDAADPCCQEGREAGRGGQGGEGRGTGCHRTEAGGW